MIDVKGIPISHRAMDIAMNFLHRQCNSDKTNAVFKINEKIFDNQIAIKKAYDELIDREIYELRQRKFILINYLGD